MGAIFDNSLHGFGFRGKGTLQSRPASMCRLSMTDERSVQTSALLYFEPAPQLISASQAELSRGIAVDHLRTLSFMTCLT